ncbi:HAD family hydrolase [uncultured Roseibium sp.]|uniref:HAD family hydrolase n=1 Tax=uncultured Roseibium sp. TaxID=1936171 RepID=UPI00262260B5|nr:HAD family hydrolase [uncultured Roseibium sp.]
MTSEIPRINTTGIEAILFDKDGTLLDFDATWTPAYEEAARFASKGILSEAERFLEKTGLDLETRNSAAGSLLAAGNSEEIAEAWIAGGADFSLDDLTSELDRIFVSKMHDAKPLTGIRETVDWLLDRGFRLGVASSDSEAAIRAFLEGSGLAPKFEFVTGYDTGHGPKPEPGMVLGFASAIGLPPAKIAVVGDNMHDIDMAKAAGAGLTIGVLTGTSAQEDLETHADIILPSASDLPRCLS